MASQLRHLGGLPASHSRAPRKIGQLPSAECRPHHEKISPGEGLPGPAGFSRPGRAIFVARQSLQPEQQPTKILGSLDLIACHAPRRDDPCCGDPECLQASR